MKTLEEIAQEKVKSLPFVDEIEVYLGYPTMLKDRLNLPINIGNMLYFRWSGITQNDLDRAEEVVNSQLVNEEALREFLITQEKWVEALERNYSEETALLKQKRDKDLDKSTTTKDDIAAGKAYEQGIIDLSKKALSS